MNLNWWFKEGYFLRDGENAYSKMVNLVYTVYNVPATETQGVYTSTVTVAVLPEMEDVDVKLMKKTKNSYLSCSGADGRISIKLSLLFTPPSGIL
ncbi:MAG: hypothetical protein ACLR5T_04415 [Veillonella sp.]